MLHWRTITPAHDDRFLVKGAELSCAIVPHTGHRFALCELRTYTADDYDREYAVRDAHAVSDADIHEGRRPPIVARFADIDAALAWCSQEIAQSDWEPFWDNPDGPGAA